LVVTTVFGYFKYIDADATRLLISNLSALAQAVWFLLVLERAGLNSSAAFAQAVWFLVLERAGSNSSAAFAQAVWFPLVLEPAHLSLAAEPSRRWAGNRYQSQMVRPATGWLIDLDKGVETILEMIVVNSQIF